LGNFDGITELTELLGERQGSFDGINMINRIGEAGPNYQIFQINGIGGRAFGLKTKLMKKMK
jgi:hypothetical protein